MAIVQRDKRVSKEEGMPQGIYDKERCVLNMGVGTLGVQSQPVLLVFFIKLKVHLFRPACVLLIIHYC